MPAALIRSPARFMLPDGKVIVGVQSYGKFFASFEVIRLNADGSRDFTFGIGAKLTVPVPWAGLRTGACR